MGKTIFHLSAILRIYDYLTMKIIPPALLQFGLPEGIKVLSKGDGYYVLLGDYRPETFTIESPVYETISVDLKAQEEEEVYLWLTPKLTSNMAKLSFTGKPNCHYYAYLPQEMRLKENKGEKDSLITIFSEENLSLIGRKLVLHQEEEGDIIEILGQENHQYRIENNGKAYGKIKTKLAVLWEGKALENGLCTIAIPRDDDYIILDEKGKKVEN